MHIVSVINYKGGVGKTTTTANLAAELAWRGYKVLLIDLDPQASLTFSFIKPDEWVKSFAKNRTIKSWFDSFQEKKQIRLYKLIFNPKKVNAIVNNGIGGLLSLIPSHLGLLNVDLELATELGGANLQQAKRNFLRVHRRLAEGIKTIVQDYHINYDVILIDCPPNFNIVTKTAIVASDHILIPAKPDYLSTLGIDYLIRNLRTLVNDYNDYAMLNDSNDPNINPKLLGVVFTMIQVHGGRPIGSQRPYIKQTQKLGVPVFKSWIRENKTIFADAPQYGVPVVLKNYSSETYQNITDELEEFVSEFEEKLKL